LLTQRFGEAPPPLAPEPARDAAFARIAGRGVVRRFKPEPLPAALIDTLAALALSSPSKSDLQGRDILIVEDRAIRQRIDTLLADQDWVPGAPHLAIFLGNNRRQRQVHEWRGHTFANDHLDAFFNAAVDAGIALSAFVLAAEAAGVGCCPLSVIRNHSPEIAHLCALPDHVFPVAGLGFGWPERPNWVSARLPLSATVHRDRYRETSADTVDAYDRRRHAIAPYRTIRRERDLGRPAFYGWSEDKARQYSTPERADFGAYVRKIGFKLD
ncbi:MAG TPA: nitroreductase family protein, partial [Hyphomicrobiaceae bacterium]|nr:nitroreductase family protein [Hyphomicrobiaceae bacterium]